MGFLTKQIKPWHLIYFALYGLVQGFYYASIMYRVSGGV